MTKLRTGRTSTICIPDFRLGTTGLIVLRWARFKIFVLMKYNWSHLQQVRSSRARSYKEQISFSEMSTSDLHRYLRFCYNEHIFTARKRRLRRLCYHRCLSVHRGDMHVTQAPKACMTPPGSHDPTGMHAPWAHTFPGMHDPWRILRDALNERAVRILLECILVVNQITRCKSVNTWRRIFGMLFYNEIS